LLDLLGLLGWLRWLLARRRFRSLHDVHCGLDEMSFDVDDDMADLGHVIFGRVLGVFLQDTFAFVRLGPVLFE
jgi:hypothetical protein